MSTQTQPTTTDESAPCRLTVQYLVDEIPSGKHRYIRASHVARDTGVTGWLTGKWLSRLAGRWEQAGLSYESSP